MFLFHVFDLHRLMNCDAMRIQCRHFLYAFLYLNLRYTQQTQHTRSIGVNCNFPQHIQGIMTTVYAHSMQWTCSSFGDLQLIPWHCSYGMMPLPHTRCNNVCKRKRYWRIVEMELLSRIEWVSTIVIERYCTILSLRPIVPQDFERPSESWTHTNDTKHSTIS